MKIELKDYHDFCKAIREARVVGAVLEMYDAFDLLMPIFAKWSAFDGLCDQRLRWFDFVKMEMISSVGENNSLKDVQQYD